MDLIDKKWRDIDLLLNDENKKILMVVAHADDEVLFGGGILSKYAKKNWGIVCCTVPYYPESTNWADKDKKIKQFYEVCVKLKVSAYSLGIVHSRFLGDGNVEQSITEMLFKNQISNAYIGLINFLINTSPDVIITHNMFGEYLNPTHALINNIVRMYKGLIDNSVTILSFAANKEGIEENIDFLLSFNEELYNKKIDLINIYEGKNRTLKKYGIVICKKEALWYESY